MTTASTPRARTTASRSWSLEPQSHVTSSVAPVGEHAREGAGGEPVAALEARGEERDDLAAERAQDRRSMTAVAVMPSQS